MSHIRSHLPALYITIFMDAKGQVLKDAIGEGCKNVYVSTLYLYTFGFAYAK